MDILKKYKKLINDEKSDDTILSNINIGILHNIDYLMSFTLRRFVWHNLPNTIDDYILEKNLIENGGVIPVKKDDKLWLMPLQAYGVGVYAEEPPKGIYANPVLGSDTFDLKWYSDENVILFENSSRNILFKNICRYAEKLARLESTIDIILTNNNGTDLIIAKSQNIADAIEKIYNARKNGKIYVSTSDEIVDILGESFKLIEGNKKDTTPSVTELLTAYNNIFRLFMREIGIPVSKDKTQAILSDESFNENIFPQFILKDELNCRKNWCERMNEKYNLNISVELNPNLILEKSEEVEELSEVEEVEEVEEN